MRAIKTTIFFTLISFCFSAFSFSHAEPSYPSASGAVNDFAGVLDAETERQILEAAKRLEEKTTDELAVVTVKSTEPVVLKDYAIELFKRWGIGKKKKDNGVLLIVAVEDRRVEIEVGYGLEGVLTDGKCGEILDKYVVPRFKEKDVAGGMRDGAKAIVATLTGGAMPGEEEIIANMPEQTGLLNDSAGLISSTTESRLDALNKELQEKAGASIVVATVSTIGDLKVTAYAEKLFAKWGLEEKTKGKGVLLLAVKDGAWFSMYTGDVLFQKKIINGNVIGELLNNYCIPHYKKSGFDEGIYQCAGALFATITGDKAAFPEKVQAEEEQTAASPPVPYSAEPRPEDNPYFIWSVVGGVVLGILLLVWAMIYFSRPKCPKCKQRKHVRDKRHHVIKSASYSSSGMKEVTYTCSACEHTWTRRETIPQMTRSTSYSASSSSYRSSSSGSRSSSSSGSFGGGHSGGGGAGRSW